MSQNPVPTAANREMLLVYGSGGVVAKLVLRYPGCRPCEGCYTLRLLSPSGAELYAEARGDRDSLRKMLGCGRLGSVDLGLTGSHEMGEYNKHAEDEFEGLARVYLELDDTYGKRQQRDGAWFSPVQVERLTARKGTYGQGETGLDPKRIGFIRWLREHDMMES